MKKLIIPVLALTPVFVSAQNLGNLNNLLSSFGNLVDKALPIVVALALLGFFWGLAKFILNANDEDKRKEGKQLMIWGIVGLFVMVSVWGLVQFIGNALGVGSGGNNPTTVPIPTVNTP
jgi:hypothetical protein